MARFHYEDADKYGGQGGTGFFSLRDDGDTARVRIMYESIDDVEGLSVHQIEMDGKKRYVNCLREYNQHIDDCPFCKAGMFTVAKLFIPLYDIGDDKVKVWERGKKFFGRISSLCSRYPNLVSHVCEIERNGKKGDTQTTYEIYPGESDGTTLDDLPEQANIVGGLVLDKTADDMEFYLEKGYFPNGEDNDEPRSRRSRDRDNEPPVDEDRGERRSTRRTPANRRRGSEDAF